MKAFSFSPHRAVKHSKFRWAAALTIAAALHSASGQVSLNADLEAFRAQYHLPGLMAMAVKNGQIIAQGVAGTRRDGAATPAAISPDDPIVIGSCTKIMTAAISARLVERGTISWTTKVRECFTPEEVNSFDAAFPDATLEQLLAHRAGVENDEVWYPKYSGALQAQMGSVVEVRRWAAITALKDPPRAQSDNPYANLGYTIAAVMLEAKSGKSWETLIKEEVFEPFQMTSAYLGTTYTAFADPPTGVVGHVFRNESLLPVNPPSALFLKQLQGSHGAGGYVVCTMKDWMRFLSIYALEGRGYLSAATMDKLSKPFANDGNPYGLGVDAVQAAWAGGFRLAHSGSNFGQNSVFYLSQAKDFIITIYTNVDLERPADAPAGIPDPIGGAWEAVASTLVNRYANATPSGPLVDATFNFASSEVTVSEDAGTATVTVVRPLSAWAAASVAYTIIPDSAQVTTDFSGPLTGVLNFAAGEASKTIGIPLVNDSTTEGVKSFRVELGFTPSAPANGNSIEGTNPATVHIVDNDPDVIPPEITVPPAQVANTANALGAIVNYPAATATDNVGVTSLTYSRASGEMFPLGVTTVMVTARDEAGNERKESFTVTVNYTGPTVPVVTPIGVNAGPYFRGQPLGELVPSSFGLSSGMSFGGFFTPAVSDDRQLVTRAKLLLNRVISYDAIYLEDSTGAGAMPASQSSPVPDETGHALLGGVTFKSFRDPVIAPHGRIAFCAKLAKAGAGESDGVWSDLFSPNPRAVRLLLRTGKEVPGFTGGERLGSITSISVRDGQLLALITLARTRGLVTSSNDRVLLLLTGPGTGRVLVREGYPLSSQEGATVRSFSVLQPASGSPGQGRWHGGDSVVASVRLSTGEVRLVAIDALGTVTTLLSTMQTFPSVDSSAQWKSFGLPSVDREGKRFAVTGTLQPRRTVSGLGPNNNSFVLFKDEGAGWMFLARKGELIETSSGVATPSFASFYDPVVNRSGQVAFLAGLQGVGVGAKNRTALFSGTSHPPRLVARLGERVPDELGVATGAVFSKFVSYALLDGAQGNLIFVAETSGGDTNGGNRQAIWAADSGGHVRRVLRTGGTLAGMSSMLTGIKLLDSLPGSFGAGRSYNDTGSVALLATFADKTQTLLRIDLP